MRRRRTSIVSRSFDMSIHVQTTVAPGLPPVGERRDYIRHLDQLRKTDRKVAGGKGANLGELYSAHIPVPAGFVITAAAYRDAMAGPRVQTKLLQLADAPEDTEARARLHEELVSLLRETAIDDGLRSAIRQAYRGLGDMARVAVRSSATLAELDCAAGVDQTFTNVRGEDALLDAVVTCWSRPAVSARAEAQPAIAVVVQHMIDSDKAGIAFSSDPSGADPSHVLIHAAFGLGAVVVSRQVTPDTYAVDKKSLHLMNACVAQKSHKIVAGDSGDLGIALDAEQRGRRVLDDHELCELASFAVQIERHYGAPQEIEWAIFEGTTYILRSRDLPPHSVQNPASLDTTSAVRGATMKEGQRS
jgi:pyruvate,water dikinase